MLATWEQEQTAAMYYAQIPDALGMRRDLGVPGIPVAPSKHRLCWGAACNSSRAVRAAAALGFPASAALIRSPAPSTWLIVPLWTAAGIDRTDLCYR